MAGEILDCTVLASAIKRPMLAWCNLVGNGKRAQCSSAARASNNKLGQLTSALCLLSQRSQIILCCSTMNLTSHVSSSSHQQHLNVKEEIDADSVEWTIKVEGEMVPVKLEIKTEDEEKPTVCQCEECGSGGRGRVDRCTRAVNWSQAIKKEEWEGDDEQSGECDLVDCEMCFG